MGRGSWGTRTFADKAAPTEVKDLEGTAVTGVACGAEHTLFLCRRAAPAGPSHACDPFLRSCTSGPYVCVGLADGLPLRDLPRRDGVVYGCGLTEHGQLPFLRFSRSAIVDGSSSGSSDGEEEAEGAEMAGPAKPRDEITIPTRLRLPFLQVNTLFHHYLGFLYLSSC